MVRKYIKYAIPALASAAWSVGKSGLKDAARSAVRNYASSAIKYGVRSMRRKAQSGSVKSTRAVTQQHDIRNAYRYRKRGGKAWSRFRSKVRAAIQADNPRHLYQAVYKASGSSTDSTAGFDGVYFLDLNTTSQGDVFNVFKDAYATTAGDMDNYKLYLQGGSIEFMIKNTHASNPAEIDVYECIARRDDTQTGIPGTLWNTYFNDMDAIGTVGSGHPGLTPFRVPNFARSWKVTKVTKFMLDPGKAMSTSMNAKLNRVISGLKLSQSITIMKGFTRMYFFRVRGVPENSTPTGSNPASGLGAWSVAWSAITNINYQTLPTSDQTEDVDQTK